MKLCSISSGSALFSVIKAIRISREIYHHLEILTCNPLKYKTDNSILIVSICTRKSIRILRVSSQSKGAKIRNRYNQVPHLTHYTNGKTRSFFQGAQWLSGRVLDKRPRGRGWSLKDVTSLCPWARHINPSLGLVQPRKTRPFIIESLLMGGKGSNQTNQTKSFTKTYLFIQRG